MFTRRIKLFTAFDFTVHVDISWFLLALVVTWAMAWQLQSPDEKFAVTASWLMGGACALALFASIVVHELTHSIVGRLHGMRIRGITLFLLGGVAEMEEEPSTPWSEFTMAIVGPMASLGLAGVVAAAWLIADRAGAPETVTRVLMQVAGTNLVLAIFNMVPAFPLDGGRVLRSVLWALRDDILWATSIASAGGVAFGALLIGAGVLAVLVFHAWLALTWVLIGMFLLVFARMPLQRLRVRLALGGVPVRDFMQGEPVSVPRWIPLAELIENFAVRHPESSFPVVDDSGLVGLVRLDHARRVPRDEWMQRTVGELMAAMPRDVLIAADAEADEALARMARTGLPRLFVMDEDRLAGDVRMVNLLARVRRAASGT